MPSNSEKGLSHRFLWMFPKPLFGTFAALKEVYKGFTDKMCKLLDLSCMSLQSTSILPYTGVYNHSKPIWLTSICDTCTIPCVNKV